MAETMGYGIMLFALLVICFILVDATSNLGRGGRTVLLVVAMAIGTLFLSLLHEHAQTKAYASLTKDVDPGRISVSGQSTFESQILIIYQNGKLTKLVTVPGTTIQLNTGGKE